MWKLGSQRTSKPPRRALVVADHAHQIVGAAPRVEGQVWGSTIGFRWNTWPLRWSAQRVPGFFPSRHDERGRSRFLERLTVGNSHVPHTHMSQTGLIDRL
jgi:hypothetical protein